jgi:hypothetical protein
VCERERERERERETLSPCRSRASTGTDKHAFWRTLVLFHRRRSLSPSAHVDEGDPRAQAATDESAYSPPTEEAGPLWQKKESEGEESEGEEVEAAMAAVRLE